MDVDSLTADHDTTIPASWYFGRQLNASQDLRIQRPVPLDLLPKYVPSTANTTYVLCHNPVLYKQHRLERFGQCWSPELSARLWKVANLLQEWDETHGRLLYHGRGLNRIDRLLLICWDLHQDRQLPPSNTSLGDWTESMLTIIEAECRADAFKRGRQYPY